MLFNGKILTINIFLYLYDNDMIFNLYKIIGQSLGYYNIILLSISYYYLSLLLIA